MKNFIKLLQKDESGTSAIEYTLIAIPFFILIFGIIEISLYFFAASVLESSVTEASRYSLTGSQYGSGISREEYVRNQVDQRSGGLLRSAEIVFETESFGGIGDVGVAGAGTAGLGGSDQYVIFRANYDWNIITPFVQGLLTEGPYTISTQVLVKNEAF